MKETFVFVPSRIAEVIGLKGTLKWTQGEEFLLCVLLSAGVALFAKHGFSWGMKKKKQNIFFFIPVPLISQSVSLPVLCSLMWCRTSSLIFRMANYISRHISPILLMYVNPFNKF